MKQEIRDILERFGSNEGAEYTWEQWLEKHVEELEALVSEDKFQPDETGACPFCFQPFTGTETDNEIALRKWEEYRADVISWEATRTDGKQFPIDFPDWLKESE